MTKVADVSFLFSVLTIDDSFLQDPKLVYALFYVHG